MPSRPLRRFNPRAPYGARPTLGSKAPSTPRFNPRAPYGARPAEQHVRSVGLDVSIHAPRTGRDISGHVWPRALHRFQSTRPVRGATSRSGHARQGLRVSIHAPRTGRDVLADNPRCDRAGFQSTRPVRGATRKAWFEFVRLVFQSTRPVRGATSGAHLVAAVCKFQSTRPVRGATAEHGYAWQRQKRFNPRAPYGARRVRRVPAGDGGLRFNPRAPYGARLATPTTGWSPRRFQSTRPVRGATRAARPGQPVGGVSIHAPRTGRDVPHRRAREDAPPVSIHAPRTGRD